VTRFDDLGLAGYERGEGYRPGGGYGPDGLTLRGVLIGFGGTALMLAGMWLLWTLFGERVTRTIVWLFAAASMVRQGWRDVRNPLAGDEFATPEERLAKRRGARWQVAFGALMAVFAVAAFLIDGAFAR